MGVDRGDALVPEIPEEAERVLAQIEGEKRRYRRNLIISFGVLISLMVAGLVILRLDFSFMIKWLPFILTGIGYTFLVSFLAITLACVLAVVGALGRLSTNPVLNSIATSYVSLIRGTPLLVQVYMWYLALPQI
ncbi:MAG: ABC transporter permease subunit, partial [Desulfobacterales bacterium]|nr:ABC transporter permease subunit [Desulfobacterales bacterium]